MPKIKRTLPPHAVDALPNLKLASLAKQLWVHAQHLIAVGAHVFPGGIVVYDDKNKEAVVKLDSLDRTKNGIASIMELSVSYEKSNAFELKTLSIPETNGASYVDWQIEHWSYNTTKIYTEDIESAPEAARLQVALERLSRFDTNTQEQNIAVLETLRNVDYFHEHVEAFVSKNEGHPDFWKRLHFGFEKSGTIGLAGDNYDVTQTSQTYDELQAMDWLYELYDRQTPNKPHILVNEHDQYILVHINENKDERLAGTKVEVYAGDLRDTPIAVGVEVYHALSKETRTLAGFMTNGNEQMYSQRVNVEPIEQEGIAEQPFWDALNRATQWRPATEKDIARWLELPPPSETPRDGNNQNLLDMYNSAKETWLQSWRDYPLGAQVSGAADALYNPEDPARLDYLALHLQWLLQRERVILQEPSQEGAETNSMMER